MNNFVGSAICPTGDSSAKAGVEWTHDHPSPGPRNAHHDKSRTLETWLTFEPKDSHGILADVWEASRS